MGLPVVDKNGMTSEEYIQILEGNLDNMDVTELVDASAKISDLTRFERKTIRVGKVIRNGTLVIGGVCAGLAGATFPSGMAVFPAALAGFFGVSLVDCSMAVKKIKNNVYTHDDLKLKVMEKATKVPIGEFSDSDLCQILTGMKAVVDNESSEIEKCDNVRKNNTIAGLVAFGATAAATGFSIVSQSPLSASIAVMGAGATTYFLKEAHDAKVDRERCVTNVDSMASSSALIIDSYAKLLSLT